MKDITHSRRHVTVLTVTVLRKIIEKGEYIYVVFFIKIEGVPDA